MEGRNWFIRRRPSYHMDPLEEPRCHGLHTHRTKITLYEMIVKIIDHNTQIMPDMYSTGVTTAQEEADIRCADLNADGWTTQQFKLSENISILATKQYKAKTIHISYE